MLIQTIKLTYCKGLEHHYTNKITLLWVIKLFHKDIIRYDDEKPQRSRLVVIINLFILFWALVIISLFKFV